MNRPITTPTLTSQQTNSTSAAALSELRILPSAGKPKKLEKRPARGISKSLAISQARQGMRLTLQNIELYSTIKLQMDSRRLPGLHKNGDGSAMSVDASGLIRSFTTAPTQEYPEGLSYKNICYDEYGHMVSCETPWDSTFERKGPTDPQGVACWTNNRDGLPMVYIGADTSTWLGIMTVDELGFHSYVASGRYEQVLYTRTGDGSLCLTRPRSVDGIATGLETITTLTDKSRIAHQIKFLGQRAIFEKSVEVFNTERTIKHTVEVDELNANYQVVETKEILENFDLGAVMRRLLSNELSVHDFSSDTTVQADSKPMR